MLHDSKKAAGLPKPGAIDTLPFGFDAVKPALDLMSSYALEMKIIPRRYSVEELFDDTTRALNVFAVIAKNALFALRVLGDAGDKAGLGHATGDCRCTVD